MAIIVCPQPQAAEIGLEVMRRGGNAIDAAVTCAFVQGVLDPQMCGIGGCGVMLVHTAAGGEALLEFYSTAGSRAREDQWERLFIREAADRYGYVLDGWVNDVGYQSVGVPGTVAGLHEALTRFGTISWEKAIEPAIPLARDGFPVSGFMHGYWTTDYGPDVVPNVQRIQATPAARSIYTHDGKLYAIGERMVQTEYARTLERLASNGPDAFYRGEIADEIAADFEANGGFITEEDLAAYTVNVTEPLRGTYRGLQIVAAGRSSSCSRCSQNPIQGSPRRSRIQACESTTLRCPRHRQRTPASCRLDRVPELQPPPRRVPWPRTACRRAPRSESR